MERRWLLEVGTVLSFFGIWIQNHGLNNPVSVQGAILHVPNGYSIFQVNGTLPNLKMPHVHNGHWNLGI
jgi:hypothetical protein